jgi:mutual gliding-motility protein MglA
MTPSAGLPWGGAPWGGTPRGGLPDSGTAGNGTTTLPARKIPVPITGIPLKLVYWGPGLSGKTTNLKWLHARLRPELRGRLITLDTPGERTIYFDCLPLDLDPGGCAPIRLRLYTVPGQPRFRLTRRLVLQGVDGLVFVWDSRSRRLRENVGSFLEAREAVEAWGRDWKRLPRVIQLNKQDLTPLTPRTDIDAVLERLDERGPRIASVAADGVGVLETLAAIARGAVRGRRNEGTVRSRFLLR